jgi:hypothetical protein
MGDVSPDAGNPHFDCDVVDDGTPTRVRLSFHQQNLGMPDFVFSPWIPIAAYVPIRAAAGQSQAAFAAAVNASPWAWFYGHWFTTPAARLVCRGLVHQTPVPLPVSALNLPP